MSKETKCERCGVELILVEWDDERMWMEPVGFSGQGMKVYMQHGMESCAKRRADVERRIEAAFVAPGAHDQDD